MGLRVVALGLVVLAFIIKMDEWVAGTSGMAGGGQSSMRGGINWWGTTPPSSGNRAFHEYRVGTLRRLKEEQREFKEFLRRLRFAKDRAEFDQFMAERRNRPRDGASQPQSQP